MKKLLLIGMPVLLLAAGGGVFLAKQAHLGPFHGASKSAKQAGGKPTVPASVTSSEDATTADAAPPPGAARRTAVAASASSEKDDADAEQRMAHLSSLYESMPADDAGRILAKLPDGLVEDLLGRMDERQAGKLLLTLDVNRAARLTQALARKSISAAADAQPANTTDRAAPAVATTTDAGRHATTASSPQAPTTGSRSAPPSTRTAGPAASVPDDNSLP